MKDSVNYLYPMRPGEDVMAWTERLLSHASEFGTFRQCTLGWHEECSQRNEGPAAGCQCLCHRKDVYSVEGDVKDGVPVVLRTEQGKQYLLAQPGDPETMWAEWVYADSPEEAEELAKARQIG